MTLAFQKGAVFYSVYSTQALPTKIMIRDRPEYLARTRQSAQTLRIVAQLARNLLQYLVRKVVRKRNFLKLRPSQALTSRKGPATPLSSLRNTLGCHLLRNNMPGQTTFNWQRRSRRTNFNKCEPTIIKKWTER